MGLLMRALWWRRGLSLATLLVAAITIGAGSLGPMYARAADESTLRDTLTDNIGPGTLQYDFQRNVTGPDSLDSIAATGPKPGSILGYPRVLLGLEAATGADIPSTGPVPNPSYDTKLVWREDQCQHLSLTSGRCPTKPGEVMVSERTRQSDPAWVVGKKIELNDVKTSDFGAEANVVLSIVGTYRPDDPEAGYWYGKDFFQAHPGSGDGPDTIDAVFIDKSEIDQLSANTTYRVLVDYPLDPSQIRLANVAKVKRQVDELQALQGGQQAGDAFVSSISTVLTTANHQQKLVDTATLLVSLQLAVLAWLVLFQVIADAAEAKGPEIALAKLRGLSPSATVRFGLTESLSLVVLGLPLGLFGGWLAVRLFADAVLVAHTPVVLTPATWLAVLIALAGSLVAAVAASRRTLRRSVLEQWRRTPGHHPSRWMLALDLILAAVAVAGFVVLHNSGHHQQPRPATLLAPALLVFAVALLGIRLVPLILRPLLPLTRGSRRIGFFLAIRQVVRRPAGLRLAALLTVAVGLATFAIAGEGVSSANRAARAQLEVGAPEVLSLQFEPKHDPVAAIHRVDPDGKWAMAAATFLPDGGGSVAGAVLGVDTPRLTAVAYSSPRSISTASIASQLLPASVPKPVTVTGSQLRVTITASNLTAGPTPNVLFNLRTVGHPFLQARAATLKPGRHIYTAPVQCPSGCTLTGITWDRPIDVFGDLGGTALVSKFEVYQSGQWKELPADLTSASGWRKASHAGNVTDNLNISETGVTDTFTSETGGSAGITHGDSPDPMPVVSGTRGVALQPAGTTILAMTDVTQTKATYSVSQTVRVLPGVLDNGLLVDLTSIRNELPGFDSEAIWSVWLGKAAPPNALQLLKNAGLVVEPQETEAHRAETLGRQGPALALRLLVVCAIAGSILAVGGTAIAIAATGRRRSFELASLRALGIRRRTLFTGAVAEQLLLLGASLVLGVPAGYLAARLAMPSIPEFADDTPIPLRYVPHLPGVLLFAAIFAVLLAITSIIAARTLMAAAAPARLREAE